MWHAISMDISMYPWQRYLYSLFIVGAVFLEVVELKTSHPRLLVKVEQHLRYKSLSQEKHTIHHNSKYLLL